MMLRRSYWRTTAGDRARLPIVWILVLSPWSFLTGPLLSQSPVPLADQIDAYLRPLAAADQVCGSVLIVRGEEMLYEGSFGLANRELDVPVAPESRFNVASLTKPMTQIIALKLVDAGVLTPDDPIAEWLPDFPRADQITVGMLAWHKAGIPHRVTTDQEETRPMSAADIVERIEEEDLLFEPGADTAYSSAGYSVLARVLELASGMSYAQLLEKHVFGPAAMTDSVHPERYSLIPNRVSAYQTSSAGERVHAPYRHYSFLVGAGSVFSTPRDLVRLMRTVVEGGYGETVRGMLLREGDLHWNGRADGYRAFADYDAESDLYIAFANNIVTGAGDLVRAALPRIVAGEKVDPPTVPTVVAAEVDPEILERYEGTYQLRMGSDLELTVQDGEIRIGDWTLIATSERTFFSPQDWGEITVVEAEDGTVERLDWTIADETYPMPRVDP